jgi:cell wall-associated NlpC family hydrolase
MVDVADLVGTPFRYGGRGPDAYDCYGLVMECARRDGVILPDFGAHEDQGVIAAMMGASLPRWRAVGSRPGAVILIRVGRFVAHVGYQINHHQMIHAWAHSHGATIVNIDQWRHRIVGFYEYAGS